MSSVTPTPLSQQNNFSPVRPGEWEAVNEPLYDYQTYALAGTTQAYRFFATPVGQSSKTYGDTNMELSGQLSAGVAFEVRAIEIAVLPTINPSVAATVPTTTAGAAAFVNDVYTLFKADAWLQFNILSKPYLRLGCLGNFPFTKRLDGFAAYSDTTTAGATQMNKVAYAAFGGQQFQVTPVKLFPNMNFDVTLNFPSTTAVSANVRLGVILRGIKTRLSQ